MQRSAAGSLVGRVSTYVAGIAIMPSAWARSPCSTPNWTPRAGNITTLGDALWWAATAVTNVGFGDYYPVTTTGRLVAIALMLLGIASIGAVTAGGAA